MDIRIYEDLILVTRREGRSWTSYPVNPDALAQQLARVPTTSGLLPPHTLASGRMHGRPFLAVYDPPRVATLATPQRQYTIPLPPLVVAACGDDYRVWAVMVDETALAPQTPLLIAPFPNCYEDGRICWGNVEQRPEAGPRIRTVLKLFLEESFFNAHVANGKSRKYPTSVLALWEQLDRKGAQTYPRTDLLPAGGWTIGWLAGGGPWS